ncbi:MAG: hypothetical protein WCH46_06335 [bacterium]
MKSHNIRAKWFLPFAFALLVMTGINTGCQNTTGTMNPSTTHQSIDPAAVNPIALNGVDLEPTIAIQDRHNDELMAIDGVNGTGTGLTTDGKPAILIFTTREGVTGIPTSIEGVPTSITIVGEFKAFAEVASGVSTGNDKECASGTIGCIVTERPNHKSKYFLSNNHVFARENAANIGERIDQPGRYDAVPQCTQTGQIARLSAYVPIQFKRGNSNTVDCAIAEPQNGAVGNSTNANFSPTATQVAPAVGMSVKKRGRTTAYTTGTIAGVNVSTSVSYGNGLVANFVKQFYISSTTFSAAGDSGSLICDANGNPTGLLFAGSSNATIANPIGLVLNALNVDVVAGTALGTP